MKENKMHWYHWVAIYTLMGSAVAFWAIPEKTLPLGLAIVAVGIVSYLVIIKLPKSERESQD